MANKIMKCLNIIADYLNKVISFITEIFSKLWKKININVKGFLKNPTRYLFYIVSVILPIIIYFLLNDLKFFTIILISFSTFLKYLNICVFDNLCIGGRHGRRPIKQTQQECRINLKNIKESLVFGFVSLLFLWFSKEIYQVFAGE